ncbi:MAG: hypothetical protein COT35_09615 [Nitrospirae bacterium CG08_land_8_20_14_0_20_52_24]|nr:MAG: hypothetical protein COT35_09615 [Nitrospirae bacterium CG08_land_8_20_14_0_20_52_24]PJB65452.1 MAG: hypothetical protein CO095_14035 [Armatimonadetes bacterium CG_4_9_14_3_um_filter_58_7]
MHPKTYETSDLDLSAVLMTAGVSLLDAYRNGDNRTTFSFDDAQECCEVIRRGYVAGTLSQPSCALLRNLRSLKWRLHQL